MYTILGGDQQQYGPVNETEIIHWIQSGRATAGTMIHKEGGTEWVPLRSLTEFSGVLASGSAPPSPNFPPEQKKRKYQRCLGCSVLSIHSYAD